ncbi:unnamed protein product [Effrenium voratum]|uniref:Uncharacterized protein n=1 Tax=Effrenium voratum TaxID=2562239 RepID=A0AA36JRV3_9DINO|nr:unnamed protein product [Effrenium voratum]CAJ1454937.1 unnamed protein product [Effrenium voratum]
MARTLRAAPCCMILWLFGGPVQLLLWNRTFSLPRRAEIDPVTENFLLASISGVAGSVFTSWVKDMQTAQTSLSDVKMEVNMLALNTTFRLAALEKELKKMNEKIDRNHAQLVEKIDLNHAKTG